MNALSPSSIKDLQVTGRVTCRSCNSVKLQDVIQLGDLHISDFPEEVDSTAIPRVPLELVRCGSCTLVQLRHTTPPDWMYRTYWYRSGINETMVAELKDVVAHAISFVGGLSANDRVLDIGANDGTLLANYPKDVLREAFEPSDIAEDLTRTNHADQVYPTYFPPPANHQFWKDDGAAYKIVTSIAMFYDLDDPGSFIRAVKKVLHPQGVWIVQLQDLDQMLRTRAFDNIGHEHLEYYSFTSLRNVLEPHGLMIRDLESRAINGGSLRFYITHKQRPVVLGSADRLRLQAEKEANLEERLADFVWHVKAARKQILGVVYATLQAGRTVDLYGASTKANTLLQYLHLNPDQIRCAVERSPFKYGRYTVGTHIPIVSEEEWRKDPADLTLVGIWQFRNAILEREKRYLDKGGAFLFPLPWAEVVSR